MKYFAYGSNMCTSRLRARVPSCRFDAVAGLKGWALKFNKPSKDGSGKCNLEQLSHSESEIFGVVFEIAAQEKALLDDAEGVNDGYHQVPVQLPGFGGHEVFMYVADRTDNSLAPYTWYHDFVVHGAREHQLPPHYQTAIQAVRSIPDSNKRRARWNHWLLSQIPLTAAVTLSQEKAFEYKVVPGGEIIIYPSDSDGDPQGRNALVISPFAVYLTKRWIRKCKRIAVGASRDNPPRGSLGYRLKDQGITPQILSYLAPILVTEGCCSYDKQGKAGFLVHS